MAKVLKQIKIGAIDPKKDTLGIALKTKRILKKAIEETQSAKTPITLSDTLLNSASQFFGVILDTASEVMKTEEVEKDLTEKLKASGYTVEQIQAILKSVKSQIDKLAVHTSKTVNFTAADLKKILALGVSLKK